MGIYILDPKITYKQPVSIDFNILVRGIKV